MFNNDAKTIQEIIHSFHLLPHPEGGYFRETYRTQEQMPFPSFSGPRSVSTAIYYLLPQGAKSSFHRIKSDEVWHFYLGGPMALYELDEETGKMTTTYLGSNFAKGEQLQYVVPAGRWFGGIPLPSTSFSFVGCTVAPGFDFQDFELANRQLLKTRFAHSTQKREIEAIIDQLS